MHTTFLRPLFLTLFLGLSSFITAQIGVNQQDNHFPKLQVSPFVSFGIDHQTGLDFMTNFNIAARYELNDKVDLRGMVTLGKGFGFGPGGFIALLSLGGTYHLSEKEKYKNTKFIISQSERSSGGMTTTTTTYYKGKSSFRVKNGIAAELKIGTVSGFYTRLDGGYEIQVHSQAYYRDQLNINSETGYRANRNGLTSFKFMGAVALLGRPGTYDYYTDTDADPDLIEDNYVNEPHGARVALGGYLSMTHHFKPWKKMTFYVAIDGGTMFIPGIPKNATSENKFIPIIEPSIGLTIAPNKFKRTK